MPGSAIVLAGGKSTRLGRDKASEMLLGRPLLQHVLDRVRGVADEIVVVRRAGQVLPALEAGVDVKVVEDVYRDTGPLGGLYTGLQALRGPQAVTVACDMPLLQPQLLLELLRLGVEHDAVVPVRDSMPEPLCACYSRACLPVVERCLEAGAYKLSGFFDAIDVLYLDPEVWRRFDPEGLSFQNLNREEDKQRIEGLLANVRLSRGG
jgi:molybdopterin-guanine dinucleotide biosynthesis protein A